MPRPIHSSPALPSPVEAPQHTVGSAATEAIPQRGRAGSLSWSWMRVGAHIRYYTRLPDGRHAYVTHRDDTQLWQARIVKRAGDTAPVASAIRRTAADCQHWIEERYSQR